MSLFDKLNQMAKSFKHLVEHSPINALFGQKAAVVSFTEKQTGEKITAMVDYIRDQAVFYLFFDMASSTWKNLVKGSPVCLMVEDVKYSGWAEDLTGYDEFMEILAKDPSKRSDLEAVYGSLDAEDVSASQGFKNIINKNKLIRVKLSR
jgi:hypothetical protein